MVYARQRLRGADPDRYVRYDTITGERSDLLIVYTLWKRPNLLPFLSTPAAVIPVLVGGADLMIPGGQSH